MSNKENFTKTCLRSRRHLLRLWLIRRLLRPPPVLQDARQVQRLLCGGADSDDGDRRGGSVGRRGIGGGRGEVLEYTQYGL